MLKFLDTPNFNAMQRNLDIVSQRMILTSQNISNINTPHYKAKKLEFENLLFEKMEKINKSYALQMRYSGPDKKEKLQKYLEVKPVVVTDNSTETRVDGNNVSIDHENLELAKLQIQFNYMVRKITDEYNLLKHAITEGR